jgi:hypothetical protein
MITSRYIEEKDYELLSDSLLQDEYHQGTGIDFFLEPGTVCSLYSDDAGPICFVRGKALFEHGVAAIQLDIQYLNNLDHRRNMKAMVDGFAVLEKNAKANKFSGFIFNSNVPILKKFCIKRLGFVEYDENLLVKVIVGEINEVN